MILHTPDLGTGTVLADYRPRPVVGFAPSRIVLAKASVSSESRRRLAEKICGAYPQADVVEAPDTAHNPISTQLDPRRHAASDGRRRFPRALREQVYRHLVEVIRRADAELEIGLYLEETDLIDTLRMDIVPGRRNCVL